MAAEEAGQHEQIMQSVQINPLASDVSPFDCVSRLQEQVKQMGACSLPGVSIVYDRFMPMLWRAVARGFVKLEHAQFVAAGLWHGFDCGIDVSLLQGKRRFLNYKSALEARPKVCCPA